MYDNIMIHTDPNSKLLPNEMEIRNPRAEVRKMMPGISCATSGSPSPSSSAMTPYSDMTGLQTVRKDGKVLRPMNAFMLWSKGHRKELIASG